MPYTVVLFSVMHCFNDWFSEIKTTKILCNSVIVCIPTSNVCRSCTGRAMVLVAALAWHLLNLYSNWTNTSKSHKFCYCSQRTKEMIALLDELLLWFSVQREVVWGYRDWIRFYMLVASCLRATKGGDMSVYTVQPTIFTAEQNNQCRLMCIISNYFK